MVKTRTTNNGAVDESLKLLAMVDIFESLDPHEIEAIQSWCPETRVEAGEVFFSPDGPVRNAVHTSGRPGASLQKDSGRT